MRDFRRLRVWQRSHRFALNVQEAAARVPGRGFPGLAAQLRRAAMAMPANIAEGAGQDGDGAFVRHLRIAIASAAEGEAHLLLARDGRALHPARADALIDECVAIRRMLRAFVAELERRAEVAARPALPPWRQHTPPSGRGRKPAAPP